jgi:succinate dehydrogenase / fumarate reductase cytochrome b subunit
VQVPAINLTGYDFNGPQFTEHLKNEISRHDVYAMMVTGFRQPFVSAFYIIAMALLCTHLSHGIYAMFQSLGI